MAGIDDKVQAYLNGGVTRSYGLRRTNYMPIDKSSIWETYEMAAAYAANDNPNTNYCPYAGQIITVLDTNDIYKLRQRELAADKNDDKKHFILEKIMGAQSIADDYASKAEGKEQDIKAIWTIVHKLIFGENAGIENINFINLLQRLYSEEGQGFQLYKQENGNWKLDISDLNVRGNWKVETIEVNQARYLGGKVWLTVGGSLTVESVEGNTVYYKEKDRNGVAHQLLMVEGDWVICETFDGDKNLVKKVAAKILAINEAAHSVTLSTADGLDPDDELVQLGSEAEGEERGYAICLDSTVPAISIYKGLKNTELPLDPHIRLTPSSIGSILRGKFYNEATGQSIDEGLTKVQNDLSTIKTQTDRQFVIWFGDTLEDRDALTEEWNTVALCKLHLQDVFYCRTDDAGNGGKAWRFQLMDGADIETAQIGYFIWHEITDADTLLALENASRAQNTADNAQETAVSKKRVFICNAGEYPLPPYDKGDQWAQAIYSTYQNELLVCINPKTEGELFDIDDWTPAVTETTAAIRNLGTAIEISVDTKLGEYATTEWTKDQIRSIVGEEYVNEDGTVNENYRTEISQTAAYAKILSTHFIVDKNGNISYSESAGLVTKENFATLFASQSDANGLVKKAEISAIIEDEVSKVNIQANKVIISGETTVNDILHVDETGVWIGTNTEHKGIVLGADGNATFNGVVNAIRGVLQNITFSNEIRHENSEGVSNFLLGADGKLTAHGATIDGNITAENLVLTNGLNVGDNFTMNADGVFNAKNVTIEGNITATSGSITGSVMIGSGNTAIYLKQEDGYGKIVDSNGNGLYFDSSNNLILSSNGTITTTAIQFTGANLGSTFINGSFMQIKDESPGLNSEFSVQSGLILTLKLVSLPTFKPDTIGQVWNDNGTLKIVTS